MEYDVFHVAVAGILRHKTLPREHSAFCVAAAGILRQKNVTKGILRIPRAGGGDPKAKILPREYGTFRFAVAAGILRSKLDLGITAHSAWRRRGS